MFLHELKAPRGSRKRRKIVGRGSASGHGKTSCRGQKGQNARSGRGILYTLEGGQMPLIRRIPKLGFRSRRPIVYQLVKLSSLERFKQGTIVDLPLLKEHGLIHRISQPVKILLTGEITRPLTLKVNSISKRAQEKIIKAGGKIELIGYQKRRRFKFKYESGTPLTVSRAKC